MYTILHTHIHMQETREYFYTHGKGIGEEGVVTSKGNQQSTQSNTKLQEYKYQYIMCV